MYNKVKTFNKKWLIRLYNAGKINGNILTFVVICLLFIGTLLSMYNHLDTVKEIDIGKGLDIPKVIYYLYMILWGSIWFYCAWKLAPRLFKIQKFFIHLLYWLGTLFSIIAMFFFLLILSVVF